MKVGTSPRYLAMVLFGVLAAQTGPGISTIAYREPSFYEFAAGQVVTLFLNNVKSRETAVAKSLPLPTTLAGLSVTMYDDSVPAPVPVPILEARPLYDACRIEDRTAPDYSGPSSCTVFALTIQVPYFNTFGSRRDIVVSENGIAGAHFTYRIYGDRIHVATGCGPVELSPAIQNCVPLVTHPTLSTTRALIVEPEDPAAPGETVVLYAFGLGMTSPIVPAGTAAPNPPAIARRPTLSFLFGPNIAAGYWPGDTAVGAIADADHQPTFAGLTPGFAGLYQVNFKVPAPPPGTPPCNRKTNVLTNVTVVLRGVESWDSAGFCVDVPASSNTPEAKALR